MTAQVAIFNKTAVALASDSAVTIAGASTKIYQTVNKLFTLSKFHPVAVMIYGNAELMGVPWESIIKLYRNAAGPRRFNTIQEYADSFIGFLTHNDALFPMEIQRSLVKARVGVMFGSIVEEIKNRVRDQIGKVGKITPAEVAATVEAVISMYVANWEKQGILTCFGDNPAAKFIDEHRTLIEDEIKGAFGRLPLSPDLTASLQELAAAGFVRDWFLNASGVVIAGFGHAEIFPSMVEMQIESIVSRVPRFKVKDTGSVTTVGSFISPFAQRNMVDTFLTGVSPAHRSFVAGYLRKVFSKYHKGILEGIDLPEDVKQVIRTRIADAGRDLLNDLQSAATNHSRTRRVSPILDTVAVLPKEELAEMAEALVNLTSFEQRISGEMQTVGGPIDVAVISKGDGFVWIKRKHYFKPELNPYFLANYYSTPNREEQDVRPAAAAGIAADEPDPAGRATSGD
jgi:hypothetical protein